MNNADELLRRIKAVAASPPKQLPFREPETPEARGFMSEFEESGATRREGIIDYATKTVDVGPGYHRYPSIPMYSQRPSTINIREPERIPSPKAKPFMFEYDEDEEQELEEVD